MVHWILIVGHAACGAVAFVLGCLILKPPRATAPLVRGYGAALAGLLVLMFAVVAWDWPQLTASQRLTFSALCGLGVYTGWRGWRALGELGRREPGWQPRYIDHLGFTLISLFDGFAIVAAVDLGAPLPVVILAGALGVVAGILAMNRAKARLTAAPAP
jgi:hypothetical protein